MNFLNARYAAIVLEHLHGNKLMKLKYLSILVAIFFICTSTIANSLYPQRGASKSQASPTASMITPICPQAILEPVREAPAEP